MSKKTGSEIAEQRCREWKSGVLDLSHLGLTELPSCIPDSVEELRCNDNNLINLDKAPLSSLRILPCMRNQLQSIPCGFIRLQSLDCSNNHLTELPPLPSSLVTLDCSKNKLTSISSLSHLKNLYCNGNIITELPLLPTSIEYLYCHTNRITDLRSILHCSGLRCLLCHENSIPMQKLIDETPAIFLHRLYG